MNKDHALCRSENILYRGSTEPLVMKGIGKIRREEGPPALAI